jgi:hypothetical protein
VRVILCGANPGVRLFDGDVVTAYASVWVVDWSSLGSGSAIVLWHADAVRVLTDNPELGHWLERDFTRHFPEADGLPWPERAPRTAPGLGTGRGGEHQRRRPQAPGLADDRRSAGTPDVVGLPDDRRGVVALAQWDRGGELGNQPGAE